MRQVSDYLIISSVLLSSEANQPGPSLATEACYVVKQRELASREKRPFIDALFVFGERRTGHGWCGTLHSPPKGYPNTAVNSPAYSEPHPCLSPR
jgi:hypothetical protein